MLYDYYYIIWQSCMIITTLSDNAVWVLLHYLTMLYDYYYIVVWLLLHYLTMLYDYYNICVEKYKTIQLNYYISLYYNSRTIWIIPYLSQWNARTQQMAHSLLLIYV